MKSTKIIVKSKSKSYPIYFGNEIINTTGKLIQKNLPNVKKVCLISDKNVPLLLLKKLTRSLKKYNPKVYKLSIKEKTELEKIEDVEILRFLELGMEVRTVKMSKASLAVDTPEDVILMKKMISKLGLN